MTEKFLNPISASIPETLGDKAETRGEIEARAKQELIKKGREFNKDDFRFIDENEKIDQVEFKFITPRVRVYPEGLPHSLDWNLFSDNITEKDKEQLSLMFSKLKDYLGALIITDNFRYHDDRGEWERLYRGELSPETWDLYKNNRLGLTNASRPISFLNYLRSLEKAGLLLNPSAMAKLETFVNMAPDEVRRGDSYNQASLARKIEIADKDMPLIFSAVVRTMGERIPKSKN